MIETNLSARESDRWDDEDLIRECVAGNQAGWTRLVDKYRNLIFSVPIKLGFSRDDASDIFQNVCVTLLSELPRIREPRTLASWLIQVTAHQCFRWRKKNSKLLSVGLDVGGETLTPSDRLPDMVLQDLTNEQALRESSAQLSPRCRDLVDLLFLRVPPASYESAAAELGLATGSIGFIRIRCLERLRRELQQRGFR